MKQRFSRGTSRAAAIAVALSWSAAAQAFEPPNSVLWPLWEKSPTPGVLGGPGVTPPRPAIGNTLGEFQQYGGSPYLHAGTDIRGVLGDLVYTAAPGNVWIAANFTMDTCLSATNCRVYLKGTDGRYVYYYSHLRLDSGAETYKSRFRKAVHDAPGEAAGTQFGNLVLPATTAYNAGELLSEITDFPNWNHLHFSVIDSQQNFDVVHPLGALPREASGVALIDDERPIAQTVNGQQLWFTQDTTTTSVTPTGECNELKNAGKLDIIAAFKDSFYSSDPVPAGLSGDFSSIGIYSARYRVERVNSATPPTEAIWYRFDQATLECPGEVRGTACPGAPTTPEARLQLFYKHSTRADEGAIEVGSASGTSVYAHVLFAPALSCSEYTSSVDNHCAGDTINGEQYAEVLTNSWGKEGSWDSTAAADGLYRITAEGSDEAGNAVSVSRTVVVNNHNLDAHTFKDAYVRDNAEEKGELPSTLGGRPFWTSPDIVVVPAGAGKNGTPVDTLVAGVPYEVWIGVNNASCGTLDGYTVEVRSANPNLINTDWTAITAGFLNDPATALPVTLGPFESKLVGPFPYIPSVAEATVNDGHRCLLAQIKSPTDPLTQDLFHVADDNNIAQRNVQIATTSFSIQNPGPGSKPMSIEARCNGFPANNPNSLMELRLDVFDAQLAAAWTGTKGTVVSQQGGQLSVRFTRCNVTLPPVTVPAGFLRTGRMNLSLPSNVEGTYRIDLSEILSGQKVGGVSFPITGEVVPK
ncbi:MAG: hypothetical protein ABUL60_09970 [Myxococcales bacterium]